MTGKRKEDLPVLIHEAHDLWPLTLTTVGGMNKRHPFVWLMQRGENSAYRRSDYVAATMPYAEPYMRKHGLASGKFQYITNGISLDDWENRLPLKEEYKARFAEWKKQGKFIVGYFGGCGISNALDLLLEVARQFEHTDIIFVLVGNGTQKERLAKKAKKDCQTNVFFMDPVPQKMVPDLIESFDCVYIGTNSKAQIYQYGISLTKLVNAMMAAKPIVISMSAPSTHVRDYDCGFMVEAGDLQGIKSSIKKLYEMKPEERNRLGENGKKAVLEHFEYCILAEKYRRLFPQKQKVRVLFINHYAGSGEMGMDFRPYYLSREWVKKGVEVHVLAADFSHLRRKNPQVSHDFQKETIDGIHYWWVKTGKYQGNGAKRALTMLLFTGKLLLHAKKLARKLMPDVIITASTYPIDTFAGQRIKKLSRYRENKQKQ